MGSSPIFDIYIMWVSLIGFTLSKIFSNSTNQLFESKFSFNSSLIGWFFQDHLKDIYCSTGGKRFISEEKLRDNVYILSLKILGNCVLYSHQFTIAFILGYFTVLILIFITIEKSNKYFFSFCAKFFLMFIHFFFVFLELHFLFGISIIEKLVVVILLSSITILIVSSIYFILYSMFSKNILLMFKVIISKCFIWSIYAIFYFNQVFIIIDSQNSTSQNTLKEFILKVFIILQ